MKFAHYLFYFSFFILSCKKEIEPKTRIFLFTGQSNMKGKGLVAELGPEYFVTNEKLKIFYRYEMKTYKPSGTTFGPELGFGLEMNKLYPNDTIILVKVAQGGAGMICYEENWSQDSATKYDFRIQGDMYDSILIYMGITKSMCKEGIISGVLFLQGEGDINDTTLASLYKSRFYKLISNLRRDLGENNLPFIIASYRNNGLLDNLDEIPQYKINAPLKYNVYQTHYSCQFDFSDVHFLPFRDLLTHVADGYDNGHMNTPGQIEAGKLYAKKYYEKYP